MLFFFSFSFCADSLSKRRLFPKKKGIQFNRPTIYLMKISKKDPKPKTFNNHSFHFSSGIQWQETNTELNEPIWVSLALKREFRYFFFRWNIVEFGFGVDVQISSAYHSFKNCSSIGSGLQNAVISNLFFIFYSIHNKQTKKKKPQNIWFSKHEIQKSLQTADWIGCNHKYQTAKPKNKTIKLGKKNEEEEGEAK